jgi:hypothetical protein
MKRTIELTESQLTKLIQNIIKENLYDNDLYSQIMSTLSNSTSSNEEKIDILRIIIDEMESANQIRQNMRSRSRRRMDETKDDNKESDLIQIYNLYKEGKISKKHFYDFLEITDRKEQDELREYIKNKKN